MKPLLTISLNYINWFISRYVFFEYSDPKSALNAVKNGNNYKIDKTHTFKVNLITDFKKYEKIPEVIEAPKPRPFKAATDLYRPLLDPDAYDQFSVLFGATVQIWQNTVPEPTLIEERQVKFILHILSFIKDSFYFYNIEEFLIFFSIYFFEIIF